MIKTKLVATVGPACADAEVLGAMIDAGVNVFRLNFSHGTLETHAEMLGRIRTVAAEHGAVVAVMGDLCGPKIRLNRIEGGKCQLEKGATVVFRRGDALGNARMLTSSYAALLDDVQVGHRLLIDDGNVQLRARSKTADELTCEVEVPGTVSDISGSKPGGIPEKFPETCNESDCEGRCTEQEQVGPGHAPAPFVDDIPKETDDAEKED